MQWKPNTTVAAIAEQNSRFLLVEESINGKLVYNQPAGHLEYGETLIEAVKREVLEETAWEFEPESLIGVYLYPNPHQSEITYLRFCFYGNCIKEHIGQVLDNGINRAVWLTSEEIQKEQKRLRSTLVSRCVNDFQSGKRYPLDLIHHSLNYE
ncbi:MAG: NUDIX hydrolase [Legionellales bacterium]|nr:NUDIX hydrolase [Legionellales bacterium]|tara:strand:+ start:106 stop:564 length:459 start_codon:yes stop_codon:yes gene_type:complete